MQQIIIEAGKDSGSYWRELWRYRELLYFMSWRDLIIRYKQTFLGVTWALIRPIIYTFVFTLVFSKIGKVPHGDVPYPILVLAGILPWQLFANSFNGCSNSLVANSGLITKVYLPRLILPLSAMAVSVADFLVALGLMLVLMPFYGCVPDWRILTLPVWMLLALLTAASGGIWIAALNVRYRDFGSLAPLVLQVGIFITPVGFPRSAIPEKWQVLYSLNPMVGVIDGFRWCIFAGKADLNLAGLALSTFLCLLLLWSGTRYFRATEKTFADII
jgi:lipopolysaccharide transport system permease protein